MSVDHHQKTFIAERCRVYTGHLPCQSIIIQNPMKLYPPDVSVNHHQKSHLKQGQGGHLEFGCRVSVNHHQKSDSKWFVFFWAGQREIWVSVDHHRKLPSRSCGRGNGVSVDHHQKKPTRSGLTEWYPCQIDHHQKRHWPICQSLIIKNSIRRILVACGFPHIGECQSIII